ncbi:LuxR C-terminal-related transcriptional regulator [Kitasatospora purpeofusca]|uniref:LuxR C-terminal-related transcriptional regulator n=1 Tax=Kitasatospora purpeofusca TaxID=67352 RepID=UPI0035DC46F5
MTTDEPAAPAVPRTSEVLNAVLPDEAARELYLAVLREGGRIGAAGVDPADRGALEALIRLGLLVPHALDSSYVAVSPRALADQVAADLRAEGVRLLQQSERLPDRLDELVRAYERTSRHLDVTGGVEHVEGVPEIRTLLTCLAREYPHESMTMQPGGARPAGVIADMLHHTSAYLRRGGSVRTIYQPPARLDPATVDYAAEVTRLGCSIRTLAADFTRLVIFDRSVAVLPKGADGTKAVLVTDPAVVAFLVDTFEQHWHHAEGVNWAALAAGTADSAAHEQVGRLLAQGLTQRTIAARLGLSERTVAAYISRLREMYDAETLFQLGWQMRGARAGEPGA